MKRFSFFSVMMAMLLVFGLEFAACQNNNDLIGTWTGNAFLAGETSFTFASDNTVTMTTLGMTTTGTYVVSGSGNTITLRFLLGDTLYAQRNGNNLVIDGAVYTKGAATSLSAPSSPTASASASQPRSTAFVMASESDFIVSLARDGTAVIEGYTGSGGNIIIPERIQGVQVTQIRGPAFSDNKELTGVHLPEGLKDITGSEYSNYGTFIFSGINTVIIPNTVTRIGDYAFANCRNLESISIPDSVTVFGKSIFANSRIKNFTFPAGLMALKEIPESMFSNTAIEKLVIPEGIEIIREHAFSVCYNLTSVTLPSTIKRIDGAAFAGCESLTEVIIPASVTSINIDSSSFNTCTKLSLASQARLREIRNPQNIEEYNERGYAYLQQGDYDRAIADFTQAIQLDPYFGLRPYIASTDIAITYGNRGNAYYDKSDYDSAIADYTQAIRLNPNDATAYNNRGNAYNAKGDYDLAIADCTEAIRLYRTPTANPYRHRAFAYMNKGNYTQARADVNRALQINPDYESARTLSDELRQRGY